MKTAVLGGVFPPMQSDPNCFTSGSDEGNPLLILHMSMRANKKGYHTSKKQFGRVKSGSFMQDIPENEF